MKRILLGAVSALAIGLTAYAAQAQAPAPAAASAGPQLTWNLVRLSPQGDRYAFLAKQGSVQRIVVANAADNSVLLSIPATPDAVKDLEWAGEDHLLITNVTNATVDPAHFKGTKSNLTSVVAINLATHKAINVFIDPVQPRVVSAVFGQYGAAQIDGHWYGFFGDVPYETSSLGSVVRHDIDFNIYPDLYRVDLDTGEISVAAHGEPGITGWLIAPDGSVVATAVYDHKYKSWVIRRGGHGGPTLLSGSSPDHGPALISFGRSPDTVLVKIEDKGATKLLELPLAGGAAESPVDDKTAHDVLVDRATDRWLGAANDDGQLDALATGSPAAARLKAVFSAFDGQKPRLVSASADFNSVILWTPADGGSGTYWHVDIAKQSADQLATGPAPENTGSADALEWKSEEDVSMMGMQMITPGQGNQSLPLHFGTGGGAAGRTY